MKIKGLITSLMLGFIFNLVVPMQIQAQEEKAAPIIIPKQVNDVLLAGMETRQARTDIPFTIFKHIHLLAQQNLHSIFFFKMKHADLGFSETAEGEAAVETTTLSSKLHIFLKFTQLDGTLDREVYIPANFEIERSSYDPEKEEIYTTGFPLSAGKYLLSMAIASPATDSQTLDKIGTQYFEFTLPDPLSFTETLSTTTIFFVNKIERMSEPETISAVHKNVFVYSVLQIEANLAHQFAPGNNLDVFFFVVGDQKITVGDPPNQQQRNDISISYEVMKGDENVIRYAAQKYESPLISQPLPMKTSVLKKTTDESGKTTEEKIASDLEPGNYSLVINIKDNISGKT